MPIRASVHADTWAGTIILTPHPNVEEGKEKILVVETGTGSNWLTESQWETMVKEVNEMLAACQ